MAACAVLGVAVALQSATLTVLVHVGAPKTGTSFVQDLLFHLPLRYQDRTRISPIAACRMGAELVLEGEILTTELAFGRRRSPRRTPPWSCLVCLMITPSRWRDMPHPAF